VWFLQGINVLPGSFMTGQVKWAVYGAIVLVIGAALLLKMGVRRLILRTIAVILLLMGTVWFFQGINVLPGSFMTGQIKWAVYGGIADFVGLTLLWMNRGRAGGKDVAPRSEA
jgi:uncharacterized membrane-anchored protein YitT (DUF2179 family)